MKTSFVSRVCAVCSIGLMTIFATSGCGSGAGPLAVQAPGPAISEDGLATGLADDTAPVIRVMDPTGKAVAGARVMIGLRDGAPFAGNVLTTGADGSVAVPVEWTDAQPVTADARGFVRATYFGRAPGALTLTLRAAPSLQRIQVTGMTSGYGTLVDDGWVHIGIVLPSFARSELASFQLANMISPENDVMTVAGRTANVPSNIAFPRQTLRYSLINITFDKPGYRAFLEKPGSYRLMTSHARFKLNEGADAIQGGKPFSELVDLLDFVELGWRDSWVGAGGAQVDLGVTGIPLSTRVTVGSPAYDSRYSALVVAFGEFRAAYFPTDVKRIGSGQSKTLAATSAGTRSNALIVLLPKDAPSTGAAADQHSLIVGGAAQMANQRFVAVPAPPALRQGANPGLALRPPAVPSGARALQTYATLSTVVVTESGRNRLERKIGRWDLYAEGWAPSLELPNLPQSGAFPGPLRWEAGFAATPSGTPADSSIGPQAFEKASHVAKSSVDL